MKKDLCSITIAKALDELGFNRETCYCYDPRLFRIKRDLNKQIRDWNHYLRPPLFYVSVPTVDQAIDWIREKYNVVIYNHVSPFIDPKDKQNRIVYLYDVKFCNRRDGWNGRVMIATVSGSYNIYTAKRIAIMEAIRWIRKNGRPPCIEAFDYPESNDMFDLRTCSKEIPEFCIPKLVELCGNQVK